MAATKTYIPGRLYEMPLALLQADPNQPRKYIDPVALAELTASIKEQKVLVPVLFRVESSICYTVAGDRRCRAAMMAGLTTIPAICIDSPNHDAISLVENTIRADLTAVEEAEALDRLQTSRDCKQEDLATLIGKSVPTISQLLSLTKLPKAILDECRKDPAIPRHVLYEIAAKKQERSMLKAYESYKASVNPEKNTGTAPALTKVQNTVKALNSAGKKVEALEPRNLYPEEKDALIAAMAGLNGIMDTFLAAFTEPPMEETPANEASQEEPSPETTTPKKKKVLS